ncbi:MAG TPA: lactate dehydrogenase [Epsilonproteobacteria bacterium]|nr:lactate dehydrogenase [Campylobacterota bacterium]
MNIAFFEIKEKEKVFFESRLAGHTLFFFEGTIQEELTKEEPFDIVSLFIYSQIEDHLLSLLPNLKYLQTRSSGYEHVKCKSLYSREIKVSNVSGYGGPAVAEFAFSLLLNISRHTHTALERSERGNGNYLDLKGFELQGKTVGIIGLGTIGTQMAKIARGFGMKIIGYTRTYRPVYDEIGIELTGLHELLGKADVLMLALPLTPSTTHIINMHNSALIKPKAVIINIARCEVMEPLLYITLPNTIASDVCNDITLARKENFFYTPHMAYYTQEALQRILETSLKNMQQFLTGKTPQNCLKLACEKEY